jgi:hypothetical protein
MANQALAVSSRNTQGHRLTAVSVLSTVQGATADTLTFPITDQVSNAKFQCGYVIDTAYADVVATFVLQASYDNTTFFAVATIDADMTPDTTGYYSFYRDNTGVYAPYWRLMANASGLNLGTDGKMQLFYYLV